MFAWIEPLIAFILRGLGIGGATKRQPDAEAQDQRAAAVDQAARAETHLQDSQAVIAAQGATNATVTASVDADSEGHWRD